MAGSNKMKYEFIDKTVFFPEQGILAIGDLHIGYEHSLRNSGILVPETQVKETMENLRKIIVEINKKVYKLKKIVFLGDIKHYFNYERKEKIYFEKILALLREYVKDKDIVLIKGNHDKFDFTGKKMKNYYFNKGLIFFHGHINFPQIFELRVNTIVMGHLHPSVILSDKQDIKREKYKCFLVGSYKRKKIIILPSFIGSVKGTSVNEQNPDKEYFSVIPNKSLLKFKIHAINDDGKVFYFGEIKKLR